jgi:hypothetical protein
MEKNIEKIIESKILIVEGEDEKRFLKSLLSRLSIRNIQIFPIGGKTQIRQNLKALLLAPNFNYINTLGIIRDADNDPVGAFQSVCDAIRQINLVAPNDQLVLTNSSPKTAVMILPAPGEIGMLEDICLNAISSSPEMECINQYLDCIHKKTNRLPNNISKAKLYSYIASSNGPELRLGEAAEKGIFNWDNPSFEQVIRFLKLLSDA